MAFGRNQVDKKKSHVSLSSSLYLSKTKNGNGNEQNGNRGPNIGATPFNDLIDSQQFELKARQSVSIILQSMFFVKNNKYCYRRS